MLDRNNREEAFLRAALDGDEFGLRHNGNELGFMPAPQSPVDRDRAQRLDRLTAGFSYALIAFTLLYFAGQFIRWTLS